ncbi:MAG: AraC family transcriptional regulator, partial [Proteobacteria bacterium]
DYLVAVEISDTKSIPRELTVITIPARKYAVFSLNGHVSEIHSLFSRIHEEWRPETDLKPDDNGMMFEKYLESFDPKSGRGGIELWFPLN